MPLYGIAPFTVNFIDTSGPHISSWAWTFGDGSTSTLQNPVNTYTNPGTYPVSLTASNGTDTATFTDIVYVASAWAQWTQPSPAYTAFPGSDPQVMLRISNDGGRTWLPEQWRSIGKAGEYLKRVRWNRLGQARRRVFEITVTDPIPWRVVGAYFKAIKSGQQ